MKLSKAIEGYLHDCRARGYSENTVRLYSLYLPILCKHLRDPEIEDVTENDLRDFLLFLQTDYVPNRLGGDTSKLSSSAVDNHWKGIRSLFKWYTGTIKDFKRPDLNLERPKFKLPEVKALTKSEVDALLEACEYTREINPSNGRSYRRKRPTAYRDKAIVMLLLDTGLRIGELRRLKVEDVDLDTGEVIVAPHGSGQKTKPRIVYLGRKTQQTLWLYLAKREYHPSDPLFDVGYQTIRSMIKRLGKRTGIPDIHAHRFRHTFAIQFLRNGGDVFNLRRLLGHSTLDMVQHYLDLADADAKDAHRKASPVDRWRLK